MTKIVVLKDVDDLDDVASTYTIVQVVKIVEKLTADGALYDLYLLVEE